MKKVVAAATLGLLAIAGTASATDPDDVVGAVTKIHAGYLNSVVYVDIAGGAKVFNCDDATIKFTTARGDTRAVQALVTAAYLAGKPVECRVTGCDGRYQAGERCRF